METKEKLYTREEMDEIMMKRIQENTEILRENLKKWKERSSRIETCLK